MDLQSFSLEALGGGPWTAPIDLPPGEPPAANDVVVVGAGITGLSAALTLAGAGIPVLVIDREFGRGATNRSGGIVLGDTLTGAADGFERCERTLGQWIEQQRVACDFRWSPCLELGRESTLRPAPIDWRDHGSVRVAGEVPGGVLDPAQLLNGLLSKALQAGVRIVNGVKVAALATGPQGPLVLTGMSQISARDVIMATDAISWRTEGDPWPERTLTVAVQTAAAPPETVAALGLQPHQPFYSRELPLLWGRPLPDGAFVFGRELVAFPWTSAVDEIRIQIARAGETLARRVRGLHPCLAAIDMQRVWAGPTARTARGIPALVQDAAVPGVVWAGGYGGHGLAQAFTLGRRAAAHVRRQLDEAGRRL